MTSLDSQSPFFRRTIRALTLASPYVLAVRADDDLAHCLDASVCGAAALKRYNIQARAIPCAILGKAPERSLTFCVGLDVRGLYERLSADGELLPPFELWKAEHGAGLPPEGSFATHVVIEARFKGERAIIDLTLGQLRRPHRLPIPMSSVTFGDGWPALKGTGWTARYVDAPRSGDVLALLNTPPNKDYVADLHNLMDAALQSGLDVGRFQRAVAEGDPELFALATERLNRFGEI